MPDRYYSIDLSTGQQKLAQATAASAGAGSAGKIVALDAGGTLDPSLFGAGILDAETVVAFEALTAGNLVNFFDDAGTRKVRKADATNGRQAEGFVKANATLGASTTVYKNGPNDQLTGLVIGASVFLSLTPGGASTTAPTLTAGHIFQAVGYAIDANTLEFVWSAPIYIDS